MVLSEYLQCKQALVDLGSLQASLAVGARGVRPALVTCQVNEGELAVHLAFPAQDDLEDGVTAGRVGIGRRLA